MHTEREVRVEPLTEEAFAPFGEIVSMSTEVFQSQSCRT